MTSPNLYFSKWHQWILLENDEAQVGVTERVVEQLEGQVLVVDFARQGELLRRGEAYGVLEGARRVWDLVAPLSGKLIEINENAIQKPSLVAKAPYADGWLARFRILYQPEIAALLTSEQYAALPGAPPMK